MRKSEGGLRYLLEPIAFELSDETVTEIVCQKPGEIGIERGDGWTWRDVPELTFNRLDAIGILAAGQLSKRFDRANPICYTSLPHGHRCTLVGPPMTPHGTLAMSLRNPSKEKHSMDDPAYIHMMEAAAIFAPRSDPIDDELLRLYYRNEKIEFAKLAVRSGKTIGITGEPGSGKTRQLKTLATEIPIWERIVSAEDTEEVKELPQRNRVSLIYGSANVTAFEVAELVKRMLPNRVLVQEIKGKDAYPLVQILASGTKGGITTWHADEKDPWTPLELLIKMTPEGRAISDEFLRPMLKSLIDIIIHCRKDVVNGEFVYSVPSIWFRAAEEAEQERIAA